MSRLGLNNLDAVVQFILNLKPDLVIMAPEGLASLGLVDVLRCNILRVWTYTKPDGASK